MSKLQKEKTPRETLKAPQEIAERTTTFKSGAKSSGTFTRFDLIPRNFLERIADRFKIGADKYPPFNYRKGYTDKAYILDRINHLENHLLCFLNPRNKEEFKDDNLAGIGWAVAFLMECQEHPVGSKLLLEIINERAHISYRLGELD